METEDREYAGFWIRALATVIDTVFLGIIIYGLMYLTIGFDSFSIEALQSENMNNGVNASVAMANSLTGKDLYTYVFINNILPIMIVIAMWMKYKGTPGKLILGIEVVDKDTGEALSLGQSFLRYIGYIISTIPLFLGYIWVAFDKEKRAWHDYIAGSVVIIKKDDED